MESTLQADRDCASHFSSSRILRLCCTR